MQCYTKTWILLSGPGYWGPQRAQLRWRQFLSIWNKYASIFSRRVCRQRTPWIVDNVTQLVHKCNAAYKQYIQSRTNANFINFKIARNAVTGTIRHAKCSFFSHGVHAGSRHFWKHVKECSGFGKIKTSVTPRPCHNMIAAKNSANRVNNQFIEILQALKTNMQLSNLATNSERNSKCCNDFAQFSLCSVTALQIEHVVAVYHNRPPWVSTASPYLC